ncbi:serine/threonine-protein kinase [Nocardia wallacei]|uniref:serine/threonine-protein kinase n=1 Tax=Nocardia wallacei TaxID=480035 RepID=UPI0024576FF8|nr:serine/threonine-protein kinase [Nocardia wallacei]
MAGVGDRIAGRYTLREVFTRGGEGIVWRATDADLDRDVVLKCPRSDDPGGAARLRTAARNAAALRHPNIVGVHNIFEHDGVCWLVMEYVPGRSLAEIARRERKLDPAHAAAVGEQIASALAHCHDRGILHCDVSPENIIVTADDEALLTDFGSSLDLRSAGTGELPKADAARGKWQYMAPEVERGGTASPKSDVYALGAALLAVSERRRRPGPLDALLTQLMLSAPTQRPTAAGAAARFARLEQPPRGWDRVVLRRIAVGVAELAAVAVIVAAGMTMPVTAATDLFGDPRTADPCALVDPASLAEFGRIDLATDEGNFDTCDLRVRAWGEDFHPDIARVRLTLTMQAPAQTSHVRFVRTGNVTIAAEPASGTRCVRTLMVSGGGNVEITGERRPPDGPDPCALADAAVTYARNVLWHGPIPRRPGDFPAGSLARHEACALVDAATLAKVAGIDAVHPAAGFGDWSCRWDSTIDGHVTVRYDRDSPKTAAAGQPLTLAGLPGFRRVEANDDCIVQIQYRIFRATSGGDQAEVVVVKFSGARAPVRQCETVTDVAATVAANLTR